MNTLSNLPPGVTDYQIEEAAGAFDEAERHNSYGWVKPDATACYICGKKEFATPVEGFQVNDCDNCEKPVCENCAEIDCGGEGEGYQWQCGPQARAQCLTAQFEAASDEICAKLADDLEAVDRKYGTGPYDYSSLKTSIAEIRKPQAKRDRLLAEIGAQGI